MSKIKQIISKLSSAGEALKERKNRIKIINIVSVIATIAIAPTIISDLITQYTVYDKTQASIFNNEILTTVRNFKTATNITEKMRGEKADEVTAQLINRVARITELSETDPESASQVGFTSAERTEINQFLATNRRLKAGDTAVNYIEEPVTNLDGYIAESGVITFENGRPNYIHITEITTKAGQRFALKSKKNEQFAVGQRVKVSSGIKLQGNIIASAQNITLSTSAVTPRIGRKGTKLAVSIDSGSYEPSFYSRSLTPNSSECLLELPQPNPFNCYQPKFVYAANGKPLNPDPSSLLKNLLFGAESNNTFIHQGADRADARFTAAANGELYFSSFLPNPPRHFAGAQNTYTESKSVPGQGTVKYDYTSIGAYGAYPCGNFTSKSIANSPGSITSQVIRTIASKAYLEVKAGVRPQAETEALARAILTGDPSVYITMDFINQHCPVPMIFFEGENTALGTPGGFVASMNAHLFGPNLCGPGVDTYKCIQQRPRMADAIVMNAYAYSLGMLPAGVPANTRFFADPKEYGASNCRTAGDYFTKSALCGRLTGAEYWNPYLKLMVSGWDFDPFDITGMSWYGSLSTFRNRSFHGVNRWLAGWLGGSGGTNINDGVFYIMDGKKNCPDGSSSAASCLISLYPSNNKPETVPEKTYAGILVSAPSMPQGYYYFIERRTPDNSEDLKGGLFSDARKNLILTRTIYLPAYGSAVYEQKGSWFNYPQTRSAIPALVPGSSPLGVGPFPTGFCSSPRSCKQPPVTCIAAQKTADMYCEADKYNDSTLGVSVRYAGFNQADGTMRISVSLNGDDDPGLPCDAVPPQIKLTSKDGKSKHPPGSVFDVEYEVVSPSNPSCKDIRHSLTFVLPSDFEIITGEARQDIQLSGKETFKGVIQVKVKPEAEKYSGNGKLAITIPSGQSSEGVLLMEIGNDDDGLDCKKIFIESIDASGGSFVAVPNKVSRLKLRLKNNDTSQCASKDTGIDFQLRFMNSSNSDSDNSNIASALVYGIIPYRTGTKSDEYDVKNASKTDFTLRLAPGADVILDLRIAMQNTTRRSVKLVARRGLPQNANKSAEFSELTLFPQYTTAQPKANGIINAASSLGSNTSGLYPVGGLDTILSLYGENMGNFTVSGIEQSKVCNPQAPTNCLQLKMRTAQMREYDANILTVTPGQVNFTFPSKELIYDTTANFFVVANGIESDWKKFGFGAATKSISDSTGIGIFTAGVQTLKIDSKGALQYFVNADVPVEKCGYLVFYTTGLKAALPSVILNNAQVDIACNQPIISPDWGLSLTSYGLNQINLVVPESALTGINKIKFCYDNNTSCSNEATFKVAPTAAASNASLKLQSTIFSLTPKPIQSSFPQLKTSPLKTTKVAAAPALSLTCKLTDTNPVSSTAKDFSKIIQVINNSTKDKITVTGVTTIPNTYFKQTSHNIDPNGKFVYFDLKFNQSGKQTPNNKYTVTINAESQSNSASKGTCNVPVEVKR